MEQCIPHTSIKVKHNLPWINIELTKSEVKATKIIKKKENQTTSPQVRKWQADI